MDADAFEEEAIVMSFRTCFLTKFIFKRSDVFGETKAVEDGINELTAYHNDLMQVQFLTQLAKPNF